MKKTIATGNNQLNFETVLHFLKTSTKMFKRKEWTDQNVHIVMKPLTEEMKKFGFEGEGPFICL